MQKKWKITDTENDMLVDPGTNITGKKIKNGILWPMASRTTVANHEL